MRRGVGVALALLLSVAACGDGAESDSSTSAATPSEASTIRDSLGIRIVEVPPLASAPEWRLEPMWTVGSFDGEPAFGIVGIALLADGRVAVSEAGGSTAHIRILDPADGSLRETLGAFGEGPEEFMSPRRVAPTGDGGFWVADARLRRTDRFDPELRRVASVRTPNLGVAGHPELHPADSGRFVWVSSNLGPRQQGRPLLRDEGVMVHWAGDRVDTVTTFPGVEYVANGTGMGGPPWGARTMSAPAFEGVWLGDTAEPELRRYDRGGLVEIVRWPSRPEPVTEADRAAFLHRVDSMAPPGTPDEVMEMMRSLLVIDRKPHWSWMVPGTEGGVWVSLTPERGLPRVFEGPPPEREWAVLSAAGVPIGRVVTPAGVDLQWVRDGLAVGIEYDELGVERVRAFRVVR